MTASKRLVWCVKQIDIYKSPISPVSSVPSVVKAFDLLAGHHGPRGSRRNINDPAQLLRPVQRSQMQGSSFGIERTFSKDQEQQTGYLYLEVDKQGKVTGWKLDNISRLLRSSFSF
jgi:hypothetical protein